jgi:predicted acyl esterase
MDLAFVRHVARRLTHAVRPAVTITAPPDGVVVDRDVEVAVRDGTILRVNVFRPAHDGRFPVLMCAHPYGKDALPRARGTRYTVPRQLRLIPQGRPFTISAWTGWEAPDPAFWVPRGYVVVNCDLRGWGRSDGVGELLSEQEADDYHDLVEWAAGQPWSTGRVGLNGVSYLAISQWGAASRRPPHLAAICPWEGFADAYHDFARPGGVREDGFVVMWTTLLRLQRRSPVDLRAQQRRRPLFDDWWRARTRDLARVDVPALVCGSFSDHCLHSPGTFDAFRRIGSSQKWLYTHRGPKWSTYYSHEALAFQQRFFDHFLKDDDNGMPEVPRVRVEVREDAGTIVDVRGEHDWPLPGTYWRALALDAATGTLGDSGPARASSVAFATRHGHARFAYVFDDDVEITGPMWARLHVEVRDADDVYLFVGVRKMRAGHVVGFEGSYGYDRDLVTHGVVKASLRATDAERSTSWLPWHPCDTPEPLRPGEIVSVDVALAPSATLFRAGDTLRLEVQGHWFFPRNPLVGQFPAAYERSPRGTCVLHTGGASRSALHAPVAHRVAR